MGWSLPLRQIWRAFLPTQVATQGGSWQLLSPGPAPVQVPASPKRVHGWPAPAVMAVQTATPPWGMHVTPVLHSRSRGSITWRQSVVAQGLAGGGGGGGGAGGRQVPPVQVPPLVQAVPSRTLLVTQPPACAEQLAVLHSPGLAQPTAPPPWQLPLRQTSPPVQALLSEQAAVLFVCPQPACAVQVSLVHGLPSSQAPGWQLKTQLPPPWQTCPLGQFLAALSCPLSQVWN